MSKPDWDREGRGWPNRDASRFVDAAGLRWHVQVMGSGPPLLLLHGTGAATHSWRALMPVLARDFTVVAPDLPGHGFTATPAEREMTLPGVARAVRSLLGELGIAPVAVAGHSAGAAIACRMALDEPDGIGLICSINGALLPFPGIAAQLFPAAARLLFANPVTPRLFALQARLTDVGGFLRRSTGSRIDAAGLEFYGRLFRSSGHCTGALAMMAHWDLEALSRALPRLAVPLTLVHADNDRTVPAEVSRRVAAKVAGARLVSLPGLGHLAHEEAPEAVAALIVQAARAHAIVPAATEERSA